MRVFLTGATGFLGRALLLSLRRDGHLVRAWTRSAERARALLGDQAEIVEAGGGPERLAGALEGCDAVVNLAGEPILQRWSAARRAELVASRVERTAELVAALERCRARPRVLASASAVGFYGERGGERLSESSPGAAGFLPELCARWEAAALRAEALGVRVVLARTGVVLGLDGGALPAMLPAFRAGVAGRLGSGAQFVPWVHVEDWVRALRAALDDERCRGPLNVVAPEGVTNRELTRALGRALRRPALVPVPRAALRVALGGAASVLLESQRVEPERLRRMGFAFRFPTLDAALHDLLLDSRPRIERAGAHEGSAYLARRRPTHELTAQCELAVPLDEAFRFFSAPENLGLLTPRRLALRILARSGPPAEGATIDYRIRVGPLPLRWRTRFEAWQAPRRFVDVGERSPYRSWWHEHRFEARGTRSRMSDRVLFALPLGPLGALALRLAVADQLGDIFAQRALAIRLRFGAAESVARAPASAR